MVWQRFVFAAVSFVLQPFFYQTSWFYALCVLLAIALVALGYRVRVRHLHARKEELETQVEARTHELLQLVDSMNLSLQTISSGQNETEHAYLQLLHEDSAHGFRRFDFQAGQSDDALAGDTGS